MAKNTCCSSREPELSFQHCITGCSTLYVAPGSADASGLGWHLYSQDTHIPVSKSFPLWAGKMTPQLQALPALPEDAGSTPSTHTAAHGNSRPRQSGTLTLSHRVLTAEGSQPPIDVGCVVLIG